MSPSARSLEHELVFAADLGGTHLRAAAIDRSGEVQYRLKQQTPHTDSAHEIVKALVDAAEECRKAVTHARTFSVGSVAVPGAVRPEDGSVVTMPNLPCLEGFELGAALKGELGFPTIVENDANAAAVGEMWLGAGRGYKTVVCVTLGTGVGGGIILKGQLWRGVGGSAGEIGHIGVNPFGGIQCACGSQGCLEVYASATGLVRMMREAIPRFPNTSLRSSESLTAEAIYYAGLDGDQLALEVFQQMGKHMGVGLATLVNLIDPEVIIIGGGVANSWQLFERVMRQQVKERAFPDPAARVKITRAELGDDAGLLGAARLAFLD
jgi:glucokinase